MTWTPSTPSLPPGSGRPTPTSARSTGSSPPPTPESSSATYTQTLRGDGLLGHQFTPTPPPDAEDGQIGQCTGGEPAQEQPACGMERRQSPRGPNGRRVRLSAQYNATA